MTTAPLPIDAALPDLLQALQRHRRAVLQAPPGAGKTTRVPLALLEAGLVEGTILMLEPRRIAARASAERMAATLGEPVGLTVGYAMRGEAKRGPNTRIEVITEGLLTRRLQSDPALEGVGAVIFDEFHERSLQADLGLALTWEVRGALREDLMVLVMSATLDAAPVAALLDDAPVVTSEGRAFPVDTRWLDAPRSRTGRLVPDVAELVRQAMDETEGGILIFLPGEAEIRRTAQALNGVLPPDCRVLPLYGALPPEKQRAAIQPAPEGRKVVLATSIAETSLTIQDVRVVVDAGLARRPRFDPGSGMSRLVTERVTRAEADQRRGRAGRVAPGWCYRMWTRGEEGALAAFPPPEIAAADLTGLALDLAQWGADPQDLAFLTPPPAPALAEARALLTGLGALDAAGRITPHGQRLAAIPAHPRLAHMLEQAGPQAAPLAALLDDRDFLRGAGSDIAKRLDMLRGRTPVPDPARGAVARIRTEAKRLSRKGTERQDRLSAGAMLALAYPDRIGLRRPGDQPRHLLSGGKGAALDSDDPLAGQRMLTVADTDGDPREARIRLAAPVTETEIRSLYADQIEDVATCAWDGRRGRVSARRQERLGALVLSDRQWKNAPAEALAGAALDGLRALGLQAMKPKPAFALLRARLALARTSGAEMPDPSDEALLSTAETWLLPYLVGVRTVEDFASLDPTEALLAALDWDQRQTLDRLAPPHWTTPLGRKVAIDYGGEAPEIALRLQELFGTTTHPSVAGTPLRVTLLSPAGRPVQTTADLPGFWAGSYTDVRKDMRARYPRHPWPEDPTEAAPTLRTKPRGQ